MMQEPSFSDRFQVLLLQLAADGRREVLFGEGVDRARDACAPFLVGESFPDAYLEFPLLGDPFLDVTFLYNKLQPGTRIHSEAAAGTEPMLDWYASACNENEEVSFGFELDTHKPELPPAGVHFQPRKRVELVKPFCEAIGEPERAQLYLDFAARLPEGWPLSFFGMFRGRPDSPLRVCGYVGGHEGEACADDPTRLAAVFDAAGFTAYDEAMLAEVCKVMKAAPGTIDFQFDVYPDGHLGDIFAIDVQFEIKRPAIVCESFENGPGARVMSLLEELGAADERWRLTAGAAFARAIPVERDDGSIGKLCFTLIPQWVKARWRAGALQPAKLYYLGKSSFLDS